MDERRMLIRRYDVDGAQIGPALAVTGEESLIRHHLLHQDDVESLDVQYVGETDDGTGEAGADAVG